ncbi:MULTISPECIES: hypothetical protein [unclassified Pseudomonas]|uniref:hypothetical protein n=1 Tax=unclassified Pseudomonas TaxID=196821 RepID=UPI000A1F5C96|nr:MULTISPECIES: hypothetical protein [unclassified Pseudomonas]
METQIEVRAPAFNEVGTIDCELNHPDLGWIKFTASPDDCEPMGREVHAALLAGAAGAIKAYDPTIAPRFVPSTITRRQALLALLDIGMLDDLEAAIASIESAIDKRKAQIEYDTAEWSRQNTWLKAITSEIGMTPSGLDDLFINASTL